ncbi:hypothetical protein [Tateyamaria sp. ANG-S1]|uniref:hypothetical protein n=1 Tax=Tateyamaria sp. ANG-S1 TaxID=1577905 RepID=UPI00126A2483|nr:hypothetical protein [Tateyamaria sp. ANG-S1]
MPLDALQTADDSFVFHAGLQHDTPDTATTGQHALTQSLLARGTQDTDLTDAQTDTLAEFAELLDLAQAADIRTGTDALTLMGDALDMTLTQDLRATDGQKLDGIATHNGRIVLDADLSGAHLKATLIEEIAEQAFYQTFQDASDGDFGAEVVARLQGTADAAALAAYATAAENDTVQTAFGTAEASSRTPAGPEGNSFASALVFPNGLIGYDKVETRLDNPAPFERLDQPTLVNPGARDLDISGAQGRFDLNNDGVLDQYKMKAAYTNVNGDLRVLDVRPTKLIPTSESNSIVIGKGEASTTWVLRTEQAHTTASEYNWNVSVASTIEASGEFLGIGASASLTTTGGTGGSVTRTNSFTVVNEVRDTYTIPAGVYEEGTLVNYGFHIVTADVDILEYTLYILEITNAVEGFEDHVDFVGIGSGTLNDHYAGLVVTDYDINNRPFEDNALTLV